MRLLVLSSMLSLRNVEPAWPQWGQTQVILVLSCTLSLLASPKSYQ